MTLGRTNNTIGCPDCGMSWHFMTGPKAGDECPSDICPAHDNKPLSIVRAVCADFDGNGVYSVGTNAALMALSAHWKNHLAQGHSPLVISEDIIEMAHQLEIMRAEIMRRLAVAAAAIV